MLGRVADPLSSPNQPIIYLVIDDFFQLDVLTSLVLPDGLSHIACSRAASKWRSSICSRCRGPGRGSCCFKKRQTRRCRVTERVLPHTSLVILDPPKRNNPFKTRKSAQKSAKEV